MKFLEYILGGQLLKQGSKESAVVEIDASINFESGDNESKPHSPTTIDHKDTLERVREFGSADVQEHHEVENETLPTLQTQLNCRSTRETKPIDRYGFSDKDRNHTAMEKALDQNGRKEVFQAPRVFEPKSYAEALKCSDRQKWLIAIDEELCALIANGTWEYYEKPRDVR